MVTASQWREAQATESDFYLGMSLSLPNTLDVLYQNARKAQHLSLLLKAKPKTAVEIGLGPFGVGVIGFLPEIPLRLGVDPEPPITLDFNVPLHDFIAERRRHVKYVVGVGENIPLTSESMDLAICCNVVDHAFEPDKILREIARILRPGGFLFFDVDTFSLLGLLKWHTWTKRRHKGELLVTAHTYRMFEPDVGRRLRLAGFEVVQYTGHNWLSLCVGHFRISKFLLRKRR